ncbi:serine/threonine-protein kinase [Actinomadura atramentaria]|uniref:serine/threonine-protein kinase n=1 Tax=Actinomadura atramentaria TaxID=1990 RepID=UPI000399C39D|nr:serine/threonine-protein kinase [Actinomadura atramentaria]
MAALPLSKDDPAEIGGYRLTGRLGEGGQGVVYLGEAPDGRRVAVKVLKNAGAAARARFAREMAAARRVAPFCTAAVLDSSAEDELPYLVSEFVDGPSLQQHVADTGPLRGDELHRLAVNTASALAAIHAAGIVHRDLKPANVLLGPDGPRVVDFGVARAMDAEDSTQLVGTPAYFAPEWLKGDPPTAASDVFAWAGTMVYAATGQPPFGRAPTLPAVLHRVANAEPDLTGVPETLRDLLRTCLGKNPARRPTARDLITRLVEPGEPLDVTLTEALPRPARRRPARTLVACAAVGAAAWGLADALPHDRGRDPARPSPSVSSTTFHSQTSSTTVTTDQNGTTRPGPLPAAFAGTWTGTVRRAAGFGMGASTSEVTLTLRAGEGRGTTYYKAWKCRGALTVLTSVDDRLMLIEAPPGGHTTQLACAGGSLTLTRRGDRLDYSNTSLVPIEGSLGR